MRRKEWTDKQLEEVLKQMPKFRDNRDSQELYRSITSASYKKKRTNSWVLPGIATAAALALLVILLPNFSGWESSSEIEGTTESKSMEFAKKETENNTDSISLKLAEDENSDSVATVELDRTAVYEEDLEGKELLTYAIPDANGQNIVPISVLVNKNESKTWSDQFLETMPKLTEEEWGLIDYFPLNGKLTINNKKRVANIDVPADHQYGVGSASEINFKESLIQTFRYTNEIDLITFSTEGQPGIILGNDEFEQINLNVNGQQARPFYFLYVQNETQPLLVPFQAAADTPADAFAAMRNEIETHGLSPSIPNEIQFDRIVSNNDTLTIFISQGSNLSQTPEMVYGIEVILLTAKEFGYNAVEFKNAGVKNIGPFNLDQAIEVPKAPNKHEIN